MSLKPFVKVSGQGPVLVLLHGWGLHGGIWQTVLPELENKFTVYNIDLPGFGYSPVHQGDYHLDYLVESIEPLLPQECFLMGWSLGGLVATALALKSPNKISKLITVASNPSFVADNDWQNGMQAKVLESFIENLQGDYEATLLKFLSIQTMGSPSQKMDIKLLKETLFTHGKPTQKALSGGLDILYQNNLVARLCELKMPVLRLYGRLDSLVPVKVAADVEKYLPASISKIYRKSAHAPFLSSAEEFVADVTQFLLASSISGEVA